MRALPTPKYLLISVVLAGLGATASGGRVDDLYAAEVLLPGGSAKGLPEAFDTALGQVLVKVTGRRGIAGDEAVMDQFTDPVSLVQQYRIDPGGHVWILFDRTAIKRVLDKIGQPVWGEERPTTLVWLIMDEGDGTREFLAAGSDSEDGTGLFGGFPFGGSRSTENTVREILMTTAGERAVPMILPLVDSEEITTISISEVWGGFTESLLDASDRYGADAVLVGRARLPSLDRARVRWTLFLDGERFDWESDIAGGPNELADFFAARLATSIGASRRILLQVGSVGSLDDYGRVSKYLGALDIIDGLTVDRVSEGEVIFLLTVRGDVNRLKRSIALRRVLQIVDGRSRVNDDDEPTFNVVAESLYYRLTPAR